MSQQKNKSCKGCIGNLAQYGGVCCTCCEHDSYMTKSQLKEREINSKKQDLNKINEIKSLQLGRIKFLCSYIKSDINNIYKTRGCNSGFNITVLEELKTLCKMRKNKDYNWIY